MLTKTITFFIILCLSSTLSLATDHDEDGDHLDVFAGAHLVESAESISERIPLSHGESATYQIADCDIQDPEAYCWFTVTAEITPDYDSRSNLQSSSSATITCGVNIGNRLGADVAVLQQNVNATFYGNYGATPLVFNWATRQGTRTIAFGFDWRNLSGPNTNPLLGLHATHSAFSTTSGELVFGVPPFSTVTSYSTVLTVNNNGWSCS